MSSSTKGYYKYINGKQYGPYWYDRGTHHWSIKDFERIFKAVKANPQNNLDNLIPVLFSFIFELSPTFKHWMCIWLTIQSGIDFLVISTGLIKALEKILKWMKYIDSQVVIKIQKYMKRFVVITAFIFCVGLVIEFLINLLNFFSTGTFKESIKDTLQQAICNAEDTSIIDDIVRGMSTAMTMEAFEILKQNEEPESAIFAFEVYPEQ